MPFDKPFVMMQQLPALQLKVINRLFISFIYIKISMHPLMGGNPSLQTSIYGLILYLEKMGYSLFNGELEI